MGNSGRGYQVWLIGILKGGARKTTSAMFFAFVLSQLGYEVLVIDADTGTQGVTDWATNYYLANPDGELPFHVAQWAHSAGLLVPFVQQRQRDTKATIVIIDVGGEAPEVLKQAAKMADIVLSPIAAEQGEIGRVAPTRSILAGTAKKHVLFLTRVPNPGKGQAKKARLSFVKDGYEVLETEVPRNLEMYADVWGNIPKDHGAYASLTREVQNMVGL